jgi:hypothetical protein
MTPYFDADDYQGVAEEWTELRHERPMTPYFDADYYQCVAEEWKGEVYDHSRGWH